MRGQEIRRADNALDRPVFNFMHQRVAIGMHLVDVATFERSTPLLGHLVRLIID